MNNLGLIPKIPVINSSDQSDNVQRENMNNLNLNLNLSQNLTELKNSL